MERRAVSFVGTRFFIETPYIGQSVGYLGNTATTIILPLTCLIMAPTCSWATARQPT